MRTLVLIPFLLLLGNCVMQTQNFSTGKIIFTKEFGDRKWKICTIDSDGKNELILTPDSSNYALPSWSPDNKKIVFYNNTDDDYDIFIMDADGKNMYQLTHYKSAYYPKWSPDGNWIAFEGPLEGDEEIYLIHPDGTGLKRLTYHKGLDRNPTWSPDSKKIAFASRDEEGGYDIFIIPIDSPSAIKRITNTPDIIEKFPSWSPDGKKIAFHLQAIKDDIREYAIYVMNSDGTERKKLKNDAEMASWAPDGKKLVMDDVNDGNIHIVSINGSELIKLTNNGSRNIMPAWSPK